MATEIAIETRAKALVRRQTTVALVEMFEQANDPDVRGWLMDELETRNTEKFNAWLDSFADSPREFYL